MPRKRSEFTEVMYDENFKYIKQKDWTKARGEIYLNVRIHSDKSDTQVKNKNAKRYLLPYDGDPNNAPVPLRHYTQTKPEGANSKPKPRSRESWLPEVHADIQIFKQKLGYLASVAPDETQTVVKKPKKISDLWDIYREQDLEKRVNLKTFDEKLNKDTIQSHQNSFQRYIELFGDHRIDSFPKNLANKFRQFAPNLPSLTDPDKTLSPITVRSMGGHLNRFFDWCSLEELIPGRPIKLLLPSKKLKKVRTKIPTQAERNAVEAKLRAAVKEWESKDYKKKNRTTEAGRFKTLLRVFMLGNYAGMRRGEIWALPKDRIDLDQKRIYIKPVDEDGGLSKDGKPIYVKFKPKSGGDDWQPIPEKLEVFLRDDLASRNDSEKWFLDKSDGSVWYATPDGITKGIKKILDELGIEGGAVHFFRKARLNDIWEKNPNASKHFGRHQEIETTEEHYTSGEKPQGLVDLVNQIDRENKLLN